MFGFAEQEKKKTMMMKMKMKRQKKQLEKNDPEKQISLTLRNPYSVSATNAIGTVEMKHPAIGINEHKKTKSDNKPTPGMARATSPAAVSAVFTRAILACACRAFPNSCPKTATEGATSL